MATEIFAGTSSVENEYDLDEIISARKNQGLNLPNESDNDGNKEDTVVTSSSFHELTVPRNHRTALSWENVSCTVYARKKDSEGKVILDNVSGCACPGEMCAIMGPSGSGKTTILDFLADRKSNSVKQRLDGRVLVNGQQRGKDFRYYAAYVQQEDTLLGTLTVLETFMFSASLTMHNASFEKRVNAVNEALTMLGLQNCKNTAIGNIFKKGISGGQKRRVSIGIELLKNPTLVFLDEPTSGLDSEAAFKIIERLKNLAETGRTVIFTIHQPNSEIYALFSKLIIMARGKTMYNGTTIDAVAYFASLGYRLPPYTNPADFFLRLINIDFDESENKDTSLAKLQQFAEYYKNSAQSQQVCTQIKEVCATTKNSPGPDGHIGWQRTGYAVSFFKQLSLLIQRRNKENIRNPGVFWVRLAMFFMLCFLIGTTYWQIGNEHDTIQDRIGLLFYAAAFLVFMSIAVVPMFIEDRAVFVRERRNGYYSVTAHVLAECTSPVPGLLIISFISSITIFFMAGLHNGAEGFFIFTFNLFVSLYVAESMLSFIASLVPHYIIGMALGSGIYGFFMLTQGFFVLPKNIPPYWIWGFYIGFHRYTFRIFMENEFSGNNFNSTIFPRGEDVLRLYDMDDINISEDFGVLIAMAIIYRILFFLVLYYFRTGKQ